MCKKKKIMKTYIETYQFYFILNFNDLNVIIETLCN